MYVKDKQIMKKCIALISFAVISSIVLISCSKTQTQGLPDRHIVYQASDVDNPKIGFINADGSSAEIINTDFFVTQPTRSDTKQSGRCARDDLKLSSSA